MWLIVFYFYLRFNVLIWELYKFIRVYFWRLDLSSVFLVGFVGCKVLNIKFRGGCVFVCYFYMYIYIYFVFVYIFNVVFNFKEK